MVKRKIDDNRSFLCHIAGVYNDNWAAGYQPHSLLEMNLQ